MGAHSYLTVGWVVRPCGLKGRVEIVPSTDNPNRYRAGNEFLVKPRLGDSFSVVLAKAVWRKGRILADFIGVDDRSKAEALVGSELMIPEEEGRKPSGTYWRHEIIGCRVATTAGEELGSVVEIIQTGATDVYVVGEERRYLIPARREIIKSVDVEKGLMIIEPLPGLLDL